MDRSNLILHPVRLRILQLLTAGPATTDALAEAMPEVPRSSIYRHIKHLVDGGLIEYDESIDTTDPREKAYRLIDTYHVSEKDVLHLQPEDHVRSFVIYAASLIDGFERYVLHEEPPDLAHDLAGYTEAFFYATEQEMTEFAAGINSLIAPLLVNGPGETRRRRKIAFITHPEGDKT